VLRRPNWWHRSRELKRIRRESEKLFASLDLPEECDIADLCDRLSERRGRPLRLMPVSVPGAHPCGLWIMTQTVDFIVYESQTSKPHQDHIIAHELAHMVCGHRSGTGNSVDDDTARLLFPDLAPELVQKILGRGNYSSVEEREAEVTASLILERINRPVLERISAVPAEDAEAMERIERSLRRRAAVRAPAGHDGEHGHGGEHRPGGEHDGRGGRGGGGGHGDESERSAAPHPGGETTA
jgi:hypothetical protein